MQLHSKKLLTFFIAVFAACSGPIAVGQSLENDEALQKLRQLVQEGGRRPADFDAMEKLAKQAESHPLAGYAQYWLLRSLMLNPAQREDNRLVARITEFLQREQGNRVAELMRRDWLFELGRLRQWATFDPQYELLVYKDKDEPELQCYSLLSALERKQDIAAVVRSQFLAGRDTAEGCNTLFDRQVAAGQLKRLDVWLRLRSLFENNRINAAKRTAQYLPETISATLEQIADKPAFWLTRQSKQKPDATQRELIALALARMAKNEPNVAAELLQTTWQDKLSSAQQRYVWSQIGLNAARKLLPEADAWYAKADMRAQDTEQYFSDDTWQWQARAALRAAGVGRWARVVHTIERMPTELQQDPTWTYWLARGLEAQAGQSNAARAQALYRRIAGQFNFYGKLAQEELGQAIVTPPRPLPLTPNEIAQAENSPHFKRAQLLYQLGWRFDGDREWNWGTRTLTDRGLIAAADYARRLNMLDRAINTADRTQTEHDFQLRFLTPHREILMTKARANELEPAWVYGLIRQESRFVQVARSSVGASGFMQLMPATARWVAKKIGMQNFQLSQVNDVDVNLTLGTAYLKMVYDDLGGSAVLASAAYNAGPGRPKSWRASLQRPVDGALFAETIPFNETRDYVKKVLSNAVYYAALLDGKPQSLKARLGTISPTAAVASALP